MSGLHSDDVMQPALDKPLAKLRAVAVTGVGEHDVSAHAPAERVVDLRERDLPFVLKRNLVGHADLCASRRIVHGAGDEDIATHPAGAGYGVDARLDSARLGHFYLGGSIVTVDQGTYLAPALEQMHAYGGRGLTENYLGTDHSENGTGRLYNLAFEHRYSLAELLLSAGPTRLHSLRGGDLQLHWFGVAMVE